MPAEERQDMGWNLPRHKPAGPGQQATTGINGHPCQQFSTPDGAQQGHGQVFTFGNDLREEAVIAGLPTG
jgi:hypothetical protein